MERTAAPGSLELLEDHPRDARTVSSRHHVVDLEDAGFALPVPAPLEGVKSRLKDILRLNGVSFQYSSGARQVVQGVTVAVSRASRIAVTGPGGAGKSTIMKIIAGHVPPSEGAVLAVSNLYVAMLTADLVASLERHRKLTPVAYFLHRFRGGDDSEDRLSRTFELKETAHPLTPQGVEDFLADFGMGQKTCQETKIGDLGRGARAKLVLATVFWRRPQVLVVDEFDECMEHDDVRSLALALQRFPGGVILSGCSEELACALATERWIVDRGFVRCEVIPHSEAIGMNPQDSVFASKEDHRRHIKDLERRIQEAKSKSLNQRDLDQIEHELSSLKEVLLNNVVIQDSDCSEPDYPISGLGRVIDEQLCELLAEEFGANLANFRRTQREFGLKLSLLVERVSEGSDSGAGELDLIGFLAYKVWGPKSPIVSVGAVGVSNAYRGKGYGRQLMKVAEDRASMIGTQGPEGCVRGEVRLRSLPDAVHFYERIGYERIKDDDPDRPPERTPGCPDPERTITTDSPEGDDEDAPCVPMRRQCAPFSPRTAARLGPLMSPRLDPWTPKVARALEDGPTWPRMADFRLE